jgi:choice-of-anchor B domain-containing protein
MSIGAFAQDAKNVRLLAQWNDTANVRVNATGQRYNDVWGFVHNGKEYAAIGSTEGVHIIDVNTAIQVAFYPGKAAGTNIVHRDYKTYKHYLYAVCDEGMSSLQVFDLNYLPDSLHLVYESDPSNIMTVHNIFIDTAKATLYTCITRTQWFGSDHMRVYSLANPEEPVLLTKYNSRDYVHDVYVRNDTAYCSSSFYGYEVVDFSAHNNTWNPIGALSSYPFKGYNHSSWINEKGFGVMADETHGSPIKVIDVRNLQNIRVPGYFMANEHDFNCIPHNPYLKGDYVFISYYYDGFQIFDISNPEKPQKVGYYDTYPDSNRHSYKGAWGCYPYLPSGKVLLSDMQTGLYIFDVSKVYLNNIKPVPYPNLANNGVKEKDTAGHVIEDRDQLEIFPNPFNENLSLRLSKEDAGAVEITVADVAGRRLLGQSLLISDTIQPIQLTLPGNLPAGTYFVSVRTGKHHYKEKITKQ